MPVMQLVRLVNGPMHGLRRHVRSTAEIATFHYDTEDVEWPDHPGVKVTRILQATYKRVDDHTFTHVRTPQAIGDTDLRFGDELEKEEETSE